MPPRPATAVAAATAPRPPSRVATAARFYVRTLPPFALIVLQMFATYAVIAHVVPHVACRGQSNEVGWGGGWGWADGGGETGARARRARPWRERPALAPSSQAAFDQDGVSPFVRCVYNYDTDYSEHRGRKVRERGGGRKGAAGGQAARRRPATSPSLPQVGFLLLWTLSETWLGAYQILIARSMWPATARGKPVAAAAVLAAAAAALVAAAPVFRLPLDANHYIFALTWPVTQVILWCLAAPLVRATGDPTDAARYIATMVSAGAVVTVYLVLMARIVTRRALAKPVQLLLTRLVFHTAIWEGVTLIFTHFTRFVGATAPLATAPLYIWPLMYKSIYGRFLLATLDTAGSVAVLNLIMAFVGLAARVASRTPGAVRVKASYGATAAEAVEGDPAVASARAAKRALGGLAELCGVACTAAVYTFGRVSRASRRWGGERGREGERAAQPPPPPPIHHQPTASPRTPPRTSGCPPCTKR